MKEIVKNIIKSSLITLSLSVVFSTAFAEQEFVRRCGSDSQSQGQELAVLLDSGLLQEFASSSLVPRTSHVPVVFHTGDDLVSEDQIKQQIEALNEAYHDAGFAFSTAEIVKGYERRKGDQKTLNVYFFEPRTRGESGMLGMAAFPWEYESKPEQDRILLQARVVAGGENPEHRKGLVLVHETGHWLGLMHTFFDGCSSRGDFISDTTPQRYPTRGCPVGRISSCPGVRSEVSIHNYMDYSAEVCMTNFTELQMMRMKKMFAAYREN